VPEGRDNNSKQPHEQMSRCVQKTGGELRIRSVSFQTRRRDWLNLALSRSWREPTALDGQPATGPLQASAAHDSRTPHLSLRARSKCGVIAFLHNHQPLASMTDPMTTLATAASSLSSSAALSYPTTVSGVVVQVVPMTSRPEYIPELAELLYAEWSSLYQLDGIHSVAELEASFRKHSTASGSLPFTLIALAPAASPSSAPLLAGTISLDRKDLPPSSPYCPCFPWLSCFLVAAEWRGRGVGSALLEALDVEVRRRQREDGQQQQAVRWIWLWTVKSVGLYEAMGWRVVEWWFFPEKGKKIAIMRKDFSYNQEHSSRRSSSNSGEA
jgi:GNAT superfamily N-acetyltransferase